MLIFADSVPLNPNDAQVPSAGVSSVPSLESMSTRPQLRIALAPSQGLNLFGF